MTALIIGISSAFLIILVFSIFKQQNKTIVYSLALTGIGFLYVGFAWRGVPDVIINALQAILFLFIAYFGMRKGAYLLAAGYFLHGTWDFVYKYFNDASLIPPDYDLFCSSLDFILGIYILIARKQFVHKNQITQKMNASQIVS